MTDDPITTVTVIPRRRWRGVFAPGLHRAIRLRLLLLMPFACRWNGRVRDATAGLESWSHRRRAGRP